jgi:hypothetical protein
LKRFAGVLLGCALVAVLVPVGASATHKPGHNPGGQTPSYPNPSVPTLSIAAKPGTIVFGGGTVISGRLRAQTSVAGLPVVLRADEYPFTGDRPVAAVRTSSNGSYAITRRPTRNTLFRTTVFGLRSAVVRVNVRIRMSLRVSDASPRVGQRVRFRGRACPTHNRLLVRIQRRSRTGAYRTVRRTRLRASTGGCSAYRRTFRIYRDGRYRATSDDADHARGYSPTRVLDVHR